MVLSINGRGPPSVSVQFITREKDIVIIYGFVEVLKCKNFTVLLLFEISEM